MFGSCLSKLDDEMPPLHFGFQQHLTTHFMKYLYFLSIIGHGNDLQTWSFFETFEASETKRDY